MSMDGELREVWHEVEARRDDGTPTMFRIRELEPKKHLTKIFVVELPYPKTELSRLPNAADYRRLGELEEQWLRPACAALGWEVVGRKIEDGSSFLYMYGSGDPNAMIERLSPFDASLGFYDDDDPDWQEYGTLRDLLEKAKAIPATDVAKRQRATTTAIKNKPAAAPSANGETHAVITANEAPNAATTAANEARDAATTAANAASDAATTATDESTLANAATPANAPEPAKTAKATKPAKAANAAKAAKATKSAKARKPAKPGKATKPAKAKKPAKAAKTANRAKVAHAKVARATKTAKLTRATTAAKTRTKTRSAVRTATKRKRR